MKTIYLRVGDLVVFGNNKFIAEEPGLVEVPLEAIQVTKEGYTINISIIIK